MRLAIAFVAFALAGQAHAESVRIALSIGSNFGDPGEHPLQFAEQDAERVRNLFEELGGVTPEHALLLLRPNVSQVRDRFVELNGRVSELHALGRSVELVVYASSHGAQGSLHFLGTQLSLDELRDLAHATGADLSLVIVDACETGPVADKGASRGPAYTLSIDAPAATGQIFIASSGRHEAAEEWDALGGSLFTHHLLTGLRGDADFDRDGHVTLMEAFTYAQRRTIAESLDVGQHPQFDIGLSGTRDLVLTDLQQARGRVVLDAKLSGRFVLASVPRPEILLEVNKEAGEPLALAVPAGRYLLRQTAGFRVAAEQIELPYGGLACVDGSRFVVRDFAEVALKGGEPEYRPHALRMGASVATPALDGTPAQWRVSLGYRLAFGAFWAFAEVGAAQSQFSAQSLVTNDWRFDGRLSAGPRFWLGPVTLIPAAGAELSLLSQSYTRAEEARIRQVYPAIASQAVMGGAFGPQLWAELPVVGPLFVSAGAMLWIRALSASGQSTWTVAPEAELALGVRF